VRGGHWLSRWLPSLLSAHPINTGTPMHVAFVREASQRRGLRQRFFEKRIPQRSFKMFITLGCNEMTFSTNE
jgi:hypothetical protein